MKLEHTIKSLEINLRRTDLLLSKYHPGRTSRFLSRDELIQDLFDSPGGYMANYYPRNFQLPFACCIHISECQSGNPRLRGLGFCFDFVAEAFKAYLHMEATFSLLKDISEEEAILYQDHILHIMNVYFVGKLLLEAAPLKTTPSKRGYHLLFKKLKCSDVGKACAQLLGDGLGNLSKDLSHLLAEDPLPKTIGEDLILKAWWIASFCHDIGYILWFTSKMEFEKQKRALTSGSKSFKGAWPFLFRSFKAGSKAFLESAPKARDCVEGVLGELRRKLCETRTNGSGIVDHGQASALILMKHFSEQDYLSSNMDKDARINRAALFLAICAIFRHTDISHDMHKNTYKNRPKKIQIHEPEIWKHDPFAAFLTMIDELQGFVARIGWYVGKPPKPQNLRHPVLIQVPMNGFMPIKGVRFCDNRVEWIDPVRRKIKIRRSKNLVDLVWDPSTVPSKTKRQCLAGALHRLGLVPEKFEIPPCVQEAPERIKKEYLRKKKL